MSHRANSEISAKGVIRIIDQRSQNSKLNELIYVGVLLKSIKSNVTVENWSTEIEKHEPIRENFKNFNISRIDWFSGAKLFVVPTKTFGQTKIEIFLHEHAFFGTGFVIELYHRNGIKTVSFKNTDLITTSLGGTIHATIKWQIIKAEDRPTITFDANNQS